MLRRAKKARHGSNLARIRAKKRRIRAKKSKLGKYSTIVVQAWDACDIKRNEKKIVELVEKAYTKKPETSPLSRQEASEIIFDLVGDFIHWHEYPNLNEQTDIKSLSMDSLDTIEFVLEIEREFPGIEISDDEIDQIEAFTIGNVIDLVMRKVAENERKN